MDFGQGHLIAQLEKTNVICYGGQCHQIHVVSLFHPMHADNHRENGP